MSEPSEVIPVTLQESEWNALVSHFVTEAFSTMSAQAFRDALATGASIEGAVFVAVRNEAANSVLQLLAEQAADHSVLDVDVPNKMIWVTFRKEGVHLYPAAATDTKLNTGGWDDVSFLGVEHRHIFHFRVSMEVFHDDRDVEFIQFKRWLERLYSEGTLVLNHKSCEMISDDLHHKIVERFPDRRVVIEVSEDGENGSTAEYPA